MPQSVTIPGQGTVDFPDEMSPDDIKGVIQKKFPTPRPSVEPPTTPSVGQIARTAGQAAVEVGKEFVQGLVPHPDLPTLTEILFPPSIGLIETYKQAQGVGQAVKRVQEAEKTPPFSKERFEAGFSTVAQIGMLAAGGRGVRGARLSERLGFEEPRPEVAPETPPGTPATDQAVRQVQPESEVTSAPEERQIESGIPVERPRDDTGGPSTTPGSGSGLRPAAEGQAQKVTPAIAEPTQEQRGDVWYQGVSNEGKTQWVTHDLEIAKGYASRRGPEARINVYTPEQVGAEAFADPEGNAISPQEYAKHNWSTTIQTRGGLLPEPIQILSKEGQPIGKTAAAVSGAETPPAAETPTTGITEPSTPEKPLSITSIKNEQVDAERAQRGLAPVAEPARKAFGETWDKATKKIDENPNYPDELISELQKKPRALTDEEDASLLHRQVDLQNQFDKSSAEVVKASESGDESTVTEHRLRMAQLSDQLLDLYNVGKTSGTETGRGLAARKMLAAEDFSLANMMTQKRATLGGKELTAEQTAEVTQAHQNITARQLALDAYETTPKAEAYRKRLQTLAEDYRRRTAEGDFSPRKRQTILPDADLLQRKADLEQAKANFWQELQKDRLAQRSPTEKVQDTFTKWRRAFILSSPTTLAKLTSAAVERMAFTPAEELVGNVLNKIPGLSKVFRKAPTQAGTSVQAEAKALTEGFTQGMKDSWDVLKTGQSSLDLVYGKRNVLPRTGVDFIGSIHGALKTVAKRNEFARRFQQMAEREMTNGNDVSDPLLQTRLGTLAYKEANRAIFLQDSRVTAFYNRALSSLQQPEKATGRVPVSSKLGSTALKVLFPIVKVPVNIVAETMQYALGTVTGSARLANAFRRGIDTLKPEEADLIARELKKGSVGSAVMLLGYLNADKIGGYYQRGQKRGQDDVKYGHMKLFGEDIPPYLIHNPLLEQLQIGATIRRVAESKLRKRDNTPQGIPTGVMAAALGVTEEVPFVRETLGELPKLFNPNERTQFLGDFSKSLAVPQAVQWAAYQMDKRDGEPVKRQADTILENIETGIPGLREDLPEKSGRGERRR